MTLDEDLAGLDEAFKMRLANLEGYITCQQTNKAFENADSSWYFRRNTKGISSKHENNVKKKNEKDRKKQILEEYIEEQIQARKDILEFRKEENFKHKEQNIELNKKALALRAYNQQILEEH